MPVPDLRYVTRVLTRTIREHMRTSPIWAPNPAPIVSPRSPEAAGDAHLSLFLYHVARDPALTSVLPPMPEHGPQYAPMGLILSYQLTAHPQLEDDNAAEEAQIALSAAMLALQEHAMLGPDARPGGVDVFGAVGITDPNVRFNITMQQVSQAEAIGFWNPGDSAPRLAVYYQVAAQLEPLEVTRIGPRVLSYAAGVFAGGEPRLYAAEARLDLSRADGTTERVVLSPAEVPYGGRLSLIGGNLVGDGVALRLEADGWDAPVTVGAEWAVQVRDGEIVARPAAFADGVPVPPGLYRARAVVTRSFTGGDGAVRTVEFLSNPMAFFVTPNATQLAGPVAGIYTVEGQGFAPPSVPAAEVEMTVLGQPLAQGAGANPGGGEFVIDSDTQIRFAPDAAWPTGRPLPVRVLVRGASAPPQWVTL
ncbi:Pvc16 family protein [Chachezhania antarctica]|uniref:Pvc16 family protein n=1 Tax=Chachezhania antarctica TaxID=2340860 RepID=UPI000EB21232|nr:Pvc16 family protein [Chachezhania antarctica]|tara:strand:+ start:163 stop:1422 length:1260 start_codon:yes stop_codon:yes gene_type:complete